MIEEAATGAEHLHVSVANLPPLLPWSLRYNDLYPYSDLFSHIVSTRPGCPRWNAELEAYHQTSHPEVWVYLSIDHDGDTHALRQLHSRLGELRQSKLKREPEDGALVVELESAIDLLQSRQRDRWNKLYGLFDIRDKYVDNQPTKITWGVDGAFSDLGLAAMEFTASERCTPLIVAYLSSTTFTSPRPQGRRLEQIRLARPPDVEV
ncbi:hypothetical protein JCM10296v2_001287 [Rhodotorula toruloides]